MVTTLKKIRLRVIIIATLIYILALFVLIISLNQNILRTDIKRVLNTSENVEDFILKHPTAILPDNYKLLSATDKNDETKKIADGALYAETVTEKSVQITIPRYEEGKLKGYLQIVENRTSSLFESFAVFIFGLLFYFAAAFLLITRLYHNRKFIQETVSKIRSIERSPLTQSYLISQEDDKITIALNHLGESIQRQAESHTEKKENLYEFIEFFEFPIFVYNGRGKISKTNAAFKNDFADTTNLDIFSPYADFLSMLVDKMLQPDIQEKIYYFERISAYYHVRVLPLQELDNRFLVSMMDVTRYQRTLEAHKAFIADVSHEFKTPLASIKGFAEILENGKTSSKEARQFAAIINKESQRLTALVHDTLLLTKQNNRIERKKVNLLSVIQEIVKKAAPQISEKNLFMKTELSNVIQKTNQQMVYSIFENLVENAIKYTPQNGKIFVSLHSNGKKVIFTVSDNGVGLTEVQKARIFERFYRADESRSSVSGTGLGLSIVEKNVQELKGTIDVESVFGEGSTFTVTF